jgi:hypothetical protein
MILSKNSAPQSTKQITITSLGALVLGHLMINTYFSNIIVNIVGLLLTSYWIYVRTLKKNDFFSFVMVMYFCTPFPYLLAKGGGFNIVSFVIVFIYLISKNKLPSEIRLKDKLFYVFVAVLVISSVLGWVINFTGTSIQFVYSFITFFGVIFLMLVSSRIIITPSRIKIFIQLNIVLITYSLFVGLNRFIHIINFETPMLPVYGNWGSIRSYFESGGIIGSSPYYAEYSLILLMLFSVFYFIKGNSIHINKKVMLTAIIIGYINIFMSISRSAFLLSFIGLLMIFILQLKVKRIKIRKLIRYSIIIILIGGSILLIVQMTGLNYMFERLDAIEETKSNQGSFSLEKVYDGSIFQRKVAFDIAYERFYSKNSWVIGYGWGLTQNNRDAWFVDPSIKRVSVHSNYFAMLFSFGWLGAIAYFLLILRGITKSYFSIDDSNSTDFSRIFSLFFVVSLTVFLINEIKVDCLHSPAYFGTTMMWIGLAYSASNKGIIINSIRTK